MLEADALTVLSHLAALHLVAHSHIGFTELSGLQRHYSFRGYAVLL